MRSQLARLLASLMLGFLVVVILGFLAWTVNGAFAVFLSPGMYVSRLYQRWNQPVWSVVRRSPTPLLWLGADVAFYWLAFFALVNAGSALSESQGWRRKRSRFSRTIKAIAWVVLVAAVLAVVSCMINANHMLQHIRAKRAVSSGSSWLLRSPAHPQGGISLSRRRTDQHAIPFDL